MKYRFVSTGFSFFFDFANMTLTLTKSNIYGVENDNLKNNVDCTVIILLLTKSILELKVLVF